MPHMGWWTIRCRCRWVGRVDISKHSGKASILDALDALFVEHLPAHQRQLALKVDATPRPPDPDDPNDQGGIAGVWIMPEGVPCQIDTFWGDNDNGFFAKLSDGRTFPVHWVKLADGQIFKSE